MQIYKIFIIAGEASGDNIGAKLIAELKSYPNLHIIGGIGGEKMINQGVNSLFPIQELSLMGFIEILPNIFNLKRRILETAETILELKPDMVITIDSPGFCFRVVKKLKQSNLLPNTQFVHYVAPTVWAYKEKRAKLTAKLFDHLFTILPFENKYFTKEGLTTSFVGHPLTQTPLGDGTKFRKSHKLSPEDYILCLSPGSREGEVKKLLPIFIEATNLFLKHVPDCNIVIPTFHNLENLVRTLIKNLNTDKIIISSDFADKRDLINASNLALTKCGTITNEFAFNDVPMVAAYKINFISAFIIKKMLKIKHVSLINIIAGKEIIKEYLQENCTSENLLEKLLELHNNSTMCQTQLKHSHEAIKKLYNKDEKSPSQKAAITILKLLKKGKIHES